MHYSRAGQTSIYNLEALGPRRLPRSSISSSSIVVIVVSSFALLLAVGPQQIDATNDFASGPVGQQPSPLQNIIQAQRQFGPLSSLMQSVASNLTQQQPAQIGGQQQQQQQRMYNVLETLSNVGKAIQQQISSATGNQLQIVTSPGGNPTDSATNKKNEYQSIVVTDQGSSLENSSSPISSSASSSSQQQLPAFINANQQQQQQQNNYREQGELLRQEIVRRTSQLQQVVASSMDLMKNNGDLIMRRLLEQMNSRLDQAKTKADRIINEPATNEMAVKALSAINLGLNNLNNIITNIVSRLDSAAKENGGVGGGNVAQRLGQGGPPQATNNGGPQQLLQVPPLLDTAKFRQNLQQIGQQFQSAFNATQLHQQLMRQRQFLLNPSVNLSPTQQQQQQLAAANNKINLDFVASSQKQS